VAPIAPEPLVPVVSTPLKLITVSDAGTLCEMVAVTLMFVRTAGANARQISEVPRCAFVLRTSCHVRLPPVTFVIVVVPELLSVATNASNNSFAPCVHHPLPP
jgi:hypothetical protein